MPELINHTTVLFVRDIEISKQFYCSIPGLAIDLDFGKNVIFRNGFTIWEIRHDNIIPATLGKERVSGTSNRFELYFETEDIEAYFSLLHDKGVRFLHEIHEEPWGQRTFRFFDPDSHLIEIGESIKRFITRFHEKGMNPDEISKRTSVPVFEVKRLLGI
ncbi:MAG TPA: VOC family protein [Bacteroidales bacterium]|nr:VOC family protein [Bacteroidales bacterium]